MAAKESMLDKEKFDKFREEANRIYPHLNEHERDVIAMHLYLTHPGFHKQPEPPVKAPSAIAAIPAAQPVHRSKLHTYLLIAAIILLIILIGAVLKGHAQETIPPSNPMVFPGVPSGTCDATLTAINQATGDYYDCLGGAWFKIGPGAGGTIYYQTLQSGGTAQTQRPAFNFIQGANVTLTIADNPGASRTDVTIASSGGGGGTPCTTTALSLQYNNAGAFGCVAQFTYSGSTLTGASGTMDLSGMTLVKLRFGAGAVTTVNGDIAQNTTNGIWHLWSVGADRLLPANTNTGTSGQVPISNGDGTFTVADPIVSGPDAVAAAPTKNPVQIGCLFLTAPATLTNNQVGEAQCDSGQRLLVDVAVAPTTTVTGTVTANQGTSPWVDNITQIGNAAFAQGQRTSANSLSIVPASDYTPSDFGPVTPGTAGTNSALTGCVQQSPSPTANQQVALSCDTSGNLKEVINAALPTGANTIGAVTQASGPWTQNLTQVAGTALGATAVTNFGTAPAAAAVPGVNASLYAGLTGITATGSSLNINCTGGCGGASAFSDNTAFTAGTTGINITGGWYSTSPTNCTSGNACAPQLTLDRKLFVQDFQGTSPWVSNITQFGGVNLSTGTGASGTGIPRVTISNDSSLAANQSVNVNQVGGAAMSLGQQLAAASLPVVLTAAQLTTLTPLSSVSVSNFPAVQAVSSSVGSLVDGSDATQGTTTDLEITGNNSGTISGKLRGIDDLINQLEQDTRQTNVYWFNYLTAQGIDPGTGQTLGNLGIGVPSSVNPPAIVEAANPNPSAGFLSAVPGAAAMTNTLYVIKAAPGQLTGWSMGNPNASTMEFVLCYDASSTSQITVGTTTPKFVFTLPGGGGSNLLNTVGKSFNNGLICTASSSVSSSAAPATGLVVELDYE